MRSGSRITGLRPKLIQWLEQHPGEIIHERQVAEMFGVNRRYARNMLSILKAEGVAEKLTGFRLVPIEELK